MSDLPFNPKSRPYKNRSETVSILNVPYAEALALMRTNVERVALIFATE